MDKGAAAPQSPARKETRGGKVIADRYKVDRLIARGGMAAVYLAHHVKLNRPIALKILSPPPDADDPNSFEDRFRLEAETLAGLDHPNIVILHDYGETDEGRFYLAMEYISGPRLSDVLRGGPLPVERALNLILQVCSALRYAHRTGLVHRDLKPSNLLIRTTDAGQEVVKVVDFGLVKLTEKDQSITRAGLILGSPHCMAPEQVKGLDVDHRTDIYAIGVLLFRTLTGQYPFHGTNSAATMIAHLNQPVPTFYDVAPDLVVPAGLEEIVRKCLEKSPTERYDSMADLMNELAMCMNVPPEQFRSVSQSHSTIQRTLPGAQRAGTNKALIALVALLAVALVGVTVLAGGVIALQGLGAWGSDATSTSIDEPSLPAPPVDPATTPEPETIAPDAVATEIAEGSADEPETVATTPEPRPVVRPVVSRPVVRPVVRPPPVKPVDPKPVDASATGTDTDKPADGKKDGTPDGYFGLPEF